MSQSKMNRLDFALQSLVGRKVFHVYAGVTTGSVLDIHFSPSVPRARTIMNPSLPQIARTHQGECSLMVNSSWRIEDSNGRIVSASGDAMEDSAEVFAETTALIDSKLVDIEFPATPILDCILHFDCGRRLRLFCDRHLGDVDDYTIFSPIGELSVLHGS